MRILHTSDWHLGKIFHEYSLIEDQRHVLKQIIQTIKSAEEEKNPFAALVVSGDIYDRAVPPAEATTLLNDFLVQATNLFPSLHIFMISGNHDSASRLSFAASFLEKHNIHLATDTKNFTESVIVEQNGEKAAFYQLPFLQSGSIQKKSQKIPKKILMKPSMNPKNQTKTLILNLAEASSRFLRKPARKSLKATKKISKIFQKECQQF